MPIPSIEPDDVANLAIFLTSADSRCVAGQQIRLDAGLLLRGPTARPG